MNYDPFKHHRRSIRLKGYDYSQAGAYFITCVTHNREDLFGNITDGEMRSNDAGQLIQSHWAALPERFPNVQLDEFIVMPNHIHGIIVIGDDDGGAIHVGAIHVGAIHVGAIHVGAIHELPLRIQRRKMLLPKIIGYFKMNTAKRINTTRDTQGAPVWQRNYYEHIIRNERDLERIRTYIAGNPSRWESDEENPRKI